MTNRILVFFFSILCGLEFNAGATETLIKMHMPPNSITRIWYMDENYQMTPATFVNRNGNETLVKKILIIQKPTIFRYNLMNKDKEFRHMFAVFPGDTVALVLGRDYDISYLKKSDVFLEKMIGSYDNIKNENLTQTILPHFYKQIEGLKNRNSIIIDSLKNSNRIDNKLRVVLKGYNDINYFVKALSPTYQKEITTNPYLDTVMREIHANYSELMRTSDLSIYDLSSHMINYKLWLSKDKSVFGYVKLAATTMPQGLKTTLISRILEGSDKNTDDYKRTVEYLKNQGLNFFGPNLITPNIFGSKLTDSKGKHNSLAEQANDLLDNGLILLDFWASWCKPCLEEFPHLKIKMKHFGAKEVKFIGINIDTDLKAKDWLASFKKQNLSVNYRNLRLENKNKGPFISFFDVKAIPRYILIDRKGKILDFNFDPPSSDKFEVNLRSHLKTR